MCATAVIDIVFAELLLIQEHQQMQTSKRAEPERGGGRKGYS